MNQERKGEEDLHVTSMTFCEDTRCVLKLQRESTAGEIKNTISPPFMHQRLQNIEKPEKTRCTRAVRPFSDVRRCQMR